MEVFLHPSIIQTDCSKYLFTGTKIIQISNWEWYLFARATGEEVSVFTCDSKDGASQVQLDVARTAVKRLKTLKHPSVLTYLGSCETDKAVLLATEPVQPLPLFLDQASVSRFSEHQFPNCSERERKNSGRYRYLNANKAQIFSGSERLVGAVTTQASIFYCSVHLKWYYPHFFKIRSLPLLILSPQPLLKNAIFGF